MKNPLELELELSEKELEDIINQFEDGRILIEEEFGDENGTDIDHYMIKAIDPIFEVTPMKGHRSPNDPNEWVTPMKLKVTSCMCFDEWGDMVAISEYAEKMIVTAMNHRFDVKDEIS